MHPAIRIVIFLILLGVLAHARIQVPGIIFVVALLLFPRHSLRALRNSWRLLWRLRWLFLSITILYLVVTPGEPVWQGFLPWSPSREAILIVLQRLSGWAVILYLFALFSLLTTPAQWQSGIYWLLKSIRWPGCLAERLTLRMALTMQAVTELQQQFVMPRPKTKGVFWDALIGRLTTLLTQAQSHALQSPLKSVDLDALTPPRWYEWSYPLLLLLGLSGMQLAPRFWH
jgi:hypothetical protein